MYLFSRSGRLAPGAIRDGITFVGAITEKVKQHTGLDVHVWSAVMSPELGTVTWVAIVEHLEQLEQAEDKLAVADDYLELAEKNAHLFAGPLQDQLAQIVHGGPQEGAPLPAYATVARAVAANGKLSQAMADGVEIAVKATEITGRNTSFLAGATGEYGGCAWVSTFDSLSQLEESEAKLMANAEWLALIDRIGSSYAQGATQSISRRLI